MACAPSSSTGAPCACASATMSLTGLTVPSALLMCTMDTSAVCGPSIASYSSISSSPSSLIGTTRSRAPRSSHRICHGTTFEWCSMLEMMTSLPSATRCEPSECATRLIPSVVPRVNTISASSAALMNARAFARAPS